MGKRISWFAAVIGGVLAAMPVAAASGPISLQLPGYFGLVGSNGFSGSTQSPDFDFDDGTYAFSVGFGANPHIGAKLHGDGTDHYITEDGLGYVVGLTFAAGSGHYDGQVITATLDFTYSYAIAAIGEDTATVDLTFRGADNLPVSSYDYGCSTSYSVGCGSVSNIPGQFTNDFTLTQLADGSFRSDTFEVDMRVGVITHAFDTASAYIDPSFSISDPALAGASLYYSPGVTAASAAPEPASWAMLTLGFGVIGAVLRRRVRFGPSGQRPLRIGGAVADR